MELQEFTTVAKIQSVTIDKEQYEIRELTFDARKVYLDSLNKTMQVKMIGTGEKDDKGQEVMRKEITITNLSGAQRELLSSTLFRIDDNGKAIPVSSKILGTWPAKLIEQLAEIASELNGLGKADDLLQEEASKN